MSVKTWHVPMFVHLATPWTNGSHVGTSKDYWHVRIARFVWLYEC